MASSFPHSFFFLIFHMQRKKEFAGQPRACEDKSTLGYFPMHTYIFPLLTSEQGVDHTENRGRSLKQWELTVWKQHSPSRNAFPPCNNSTEITRHRVGCCHPPSFSSCTHTAMQYMRSLPIKSYIHTELSALLGWVELCQHLMKKQFSLSQTNFNAAKFNMNHR